MIEHEEREREAPCFSIFRNAKARKHIGEIRLLEFLDHIKGGKWQSEVEEVRALRQRLTESDYKRERAAILPTVSLSGVLPYRTKGQAIEAHSGLLQGDFDGKDHEGMTVEEMREIVISSPYLVAAFVSPSGTGMKAIIRVMPDVEKHKASFLAAEKHFLSLGLQLDASTKDAKRLCYVSHDPRLWCRDWREVETLMPLDVAESACHIDDTDNTDNIETQITQITQKKREKRKEQRPENGIAHRIKQAEQAQARLAEDKRLSALYARFIGKTFTARQGERNGQLVAMVTFLFRAVSEQSVMPLVMFFYDVNQDVFADSREQHEEEAAAQLANTRRTWLESLNEAESLMRENLAEISPRHENAFRVCRELADDEGVFFLSCAELGKRIDIDRQQASRIFRQFIAQGILAEVKKGTQHKAIVTDGKKRVQSGKATVYRWKL